MNSFFPHMDLIRYTQEEQKCRPSYKGLLTFKLTYG